MESQNSNTTISSNKSASNINGSVPLSNQQIISEPHSVPWVVILLIIIFQPAAWYFMYREKRYHRWFSYLLWLNAGGSLFVYLLQVVFVMPQLEILYKSLNVPHSYTNFYIAFALLIVPSFAEIIVGILLYKKTKQPNISYNKLLKVAIGLLIVNFLFAGYSVAHSVVSIITPIYSLTSSIK